ncbi:MAG: PAS domain S-box protein [Deltaproteobacteria bacterium]|nr:PAS domain S-box protein [Candidatus Anaeroferrophillacea bacterium]
MNVARSTGSGTAAGTRPDEIEELYRDLFDNAPVGIFRTTARGEALEVNSALARMLGLGTPAAVAHYRDLGTQLYVDPERRREFIRRLQRDRQVKNFEYEARTVDGRHVWVSVNARAKPGPKDDPDNFTIEGFTTDITEYRQAEKFLRQSEVRHRTILKTAMDGFWIADRDGRLLEVNDTYAATSGYSVAALLTMRIADLEDIESPLDVAARMQRLFERGQDRFESRHRRRDGSTFPVEVSVQYRPEAPDLIITFLRDITEIRNVREELRRSEARYRLLFEEGPDGVVVLDPETAAIIEFNDQACRQLGYSREEFSQLNVADIDVVESPDDTAARIADVIETGRADFETSHRAKDGGLRHARVTAQAHRVEADLIYHCIWRDITDWKRAEEEREKLQAQLLQAQKMESVGRLAGGVAHDFNNMLGVILGHAELVLEQLEPGSLLFGSLKDIRAATERSAALTRQLLAFARRQAISPRVLDLNDTMQGMLKMLRRLISENIELLWHPDPALWPIRVDPSQVDQIAANLCVNARDAIAGTGTIGIETANVSCDREYCAGHPDCMPGDYVRLTVRDDGCGIDREIVERIFEPFFTTKELGMGTGLGLSTVYGIVTQNNGFIAVNSVPGAGTAFAVHLPRYRSGTVSAGALDVSEETTAEHETILLVENEPAILDMTGIMLRRLGYRVLPAGSPGAAIRLARAYHGKIDLLLTDVIMPEMNGRDLAAALHQSRPGLRSLFMSGYTADIIARHGVLDQHIHFIQKPFSRKEVAIKQAGTD